jgi:hypothetical protein
MYMYMYMYMYACLCACRMNCRTGFQDPIDVLKRDEELKESIESSMKEEREMKFLVKVCLGSSFHSLIRSMVVIIGTTITGDSY